MRNKKQHYGARVLIQKYLPTFCWQTLQEILTMLEQFDIDAPMDYNALKATLCEATKRGCVLKRRVLRPPAPKGIKIPSRYEYRRNPEWRYERCHKPILS